MALKISIPPGYSIIADKGPLKAVLRAAGAEVAARARALIRSGAATAKRAARRASVAGTPPVGRTGNLARGMKITLWRDGQGVTIKDTARSPRGSGAPYALFLEKGAQGGVGGRAPKRNQWKKINRQRIRVSVSGTRILQPHPFMEPALDQVVANNLAVRVRDAVVSGLKFRRG